MTPELTNLVNLVLWLVGELAKLGGVAALIAALVNILKYAGVVKDGQAGDWSLLLNALAAIGLVFAKFYNFDLGSVDSLAGSFANVAVAVLAFLVQLNATGWLHTNALAGFKIIGKSYSQG